MIGAIQTRVGLPTLLVLLVLASNTARAQNESLLARGGYLVEGILACGNCHTPKSSGAVPISEMKFAGAFVIEEPGIVAYASNITMDEETGIGHWTDAEITRAVRDGLRPDGTLIGPPMPSPFYRDISDNDMRAIVAYLRTIDAVSNVVPASEYNIPLPDAYGPPVGTVDDVSPDDPLAYATYVAVALGHCIECHTPMVQGRHDFTRTNAGGRIFEDLFGLGRTLVSRNVTPHRVLGIGAWTDAEIKRAITEGISRDGREHIPGMAYPYYATMTEGDLDALVAYLRSRPPMPPN
jgi:mono/diheme cytochrome c family protein